MRRLKQLEKLNAQPIGSRHVSLEHRLKILPQYVAHFLSAIALICAYLHWPLQQSEPKYVLVPTDGLFDVGDANSYMVYRPGVGLTNWVFLGRHTFKLGSLNRRINGDDSGKRLSKLLLKLGLRKPSFRSATNAEVLAAACCYPTDIHKRSLGKGLNDNTLDRIPENKGELLVVFGRQDPHIPREGRATIYNALADAGTNFSWHEFNGAHAFMRDEGARYDAAAVRTVYAMALDLFRRKLSEGDLSQIQGSTEARH